MPFKPLGIELPLASICISIWLILLEQMNLLNHTLPICP